MSPTRGELFLAYLRIGLTGFGGVNAWARQLLVERKGWLSDQHYAEALGMGQVLPGPNALNCAIAIGARFHGGAGALLACAGLLLGPMAVLVAVAALYDQYGQLPLVRAVLTGIAAAAAGMVLGTAVKMAVKLRPTPLLWLTGALALLLAMLRVPLPLVLLGLAPLGIWAAGRR